MKSSQIKQQRGMIQKPASNKNRREASQHKNIGLQSTPVQKMVDESQQDDSASPYPTVLPVFEETIYKDQTRATMQHRDFSLEENLSFIPQPIEMTYQNPAPIDMKIAANDADRQGLKKSQPAATQSSKKVSLPTEYSLKKTLALKNQKQRSSSVAKTRVPASKLEEQHIPKTISSACLTPSQIFDNPSTNGASVGVSGAGVDDDIIVENKNLKQQIAQLQNVIVSMCVLNQRQTSVRNTTNSKLKEVRSRSGQTLSRSLSLNLNAKPLNDTGLTGQSNKIARLNGISSNKKQVEPHPESLLIEPIARPALLSTIPNDWMVDQQPPKFAHTVKTSPVASKISMTKCQPQSSHERRYSYQGLFNSQPRRSKDHFAPITNESEIYRQHINLVNNVMLPEAEVDLNDADIELCPEKLLLSAHLPQHYQQVQYSGIKQSKIGSKAAVAQQDNSLRGRSHAVRNQNNNDDVPSFMRKTYSSQAKQVVKTGTSESAASSSASSNFATRYTSSRRQNNLANYNNRRPDFDLSQTRSSGSNIKAYFNKTMSMATYTDQKSDKNNIFSDSDSQAEVSICALSQADARQFLNQKSQFKDDIIDNCHMSSTQIVQTPAIISGSSSKFSSKIRSSKKKTNVKRQEFKDLTKRQNRLTNQINDTKAVATASSQKPVKKRNQPQLNSATPAPSKAEQDRLLFQKTMETIKSDQNMRKLKQEVKYKKQLDLNSSMNKEDLAKVLLDATSKSLNSSQKLMSNSNQLNKQRMVKQQEELGASTAVQKQKLEQQVTSPAQLASDPDYIEGAMPNTAKFDSAIKESTQQGIEILTQQYKNFKSGQNTEDETDSSQEDAKQMLLDRMEDQSPLKSGPSTVKGPLSTYESPLGKQSIVQVDMTSSMKKIIIPPLNFEKVFEQQRLILELEDRRKKEEQKRQLLLEQQKMKAQAFSAKKSNSSKQQYSHSKKRQQSTSQKKKKPQPIEFSSQNTKYEESPESKLFYNIEEENSKIVHVYGGQNVQEAEINDFETIVKVDKKTEEKLMLRNIEAGSGKKNVNKAGNKKSEFKTGQVSNFDAPEEPISQAPQAFQAPNKPITRIISNHSVKPNIKFEINTSWKSSEVKKTSITPSKQHEKLSFQKKKTSVTKPAQNQKLVPSQSNSVTRKDPIQKDSLQNQNKQKKQVFTLNKNINNYAVSQTANQTPKSRSYVKHVPSQQNQPQQVVSKTQTQTPKSRLSTDGEDFIQNHLNGSSGIKQSSKADSLYKTYDKVATIQKRTKVANISLVEEKRPAIVNKRRLKEYKQVRNSLETTQDLLDSFDQKKTSYQKRSYSRVQIDDLLQPVLKQAKTRTISQYPQVDPATDLIFIENKKSSLISPNSTQVGHNRTTSLVKAYSNISAKTSNRVIVGGSKQSRNQRSRLQKVATKTTATAFDNADICDIDNQLSLSVKVPVQAPSILRKTNCTQNTASNSSSGIFVQNSTSSGCLTNQQVPNSAVTLGQRTQNTIVTDHQSSTVHKTTETPSKKSSSTVRYPPANSSSAADIFRPRGSSVIDTICSLSKKRSGILQRQASAINHVESKGRSWKF